MKHHPNHWPFNSWAKICGSIFFFDKFNVEQAQDFEDPEVHHRHVSHLFGLFPGHTITIEKTPDLCKAADYTLYKRGECVCVVKQSTFHVSRKDNAKMKLFV